MELKEIRIVLDCETLRLFKFQGGKDGSCYMVPTPDYNVTGDHISFHPSGVVNFTASGKVEAYDLVRKNAEVFVNGVQVCIERIDPKKLRKVLVLKVPDVNEGFKEGILTIDLRDIPQHIERVVFSPKYLGFLKKYYSDKYLILLYNKKGDVSIPIKNRHGYHVSTERLIEYLDEHSVV